MDGIKAYNTYSKVNNNQNNTDQGNFNGTNNPALTPLDSSIVNTATRPVREQGFFSLQTLKSYLIPTALFCWLLFWN